MPIDYSAAPPVKAKRGTSAATPRAPKPAAVDFKVEGYKTTLEQIRDLLVTGLSFAGQDADAAAVHLHSEPALPVYARLAKDIPAVGSFLDSFNGVGGKYMEAVMVTLPLVLQLAANHKAMRVGPQMTAMFNVQPPELLAAQMQTKKAQMLRDAQQAAQAAQEEAQRIMAEVTAPQFQEPAA